MARPKKCRRVCSMPNISVFTPQGSFNGRVNLNVDEYEAIRLIDQLGLTHEEAAKQMDVSRSTITSIYDSARKAIASAITGKQAIVIGGGDVELCENSSRCCGICAKNKCGKCNGGTCEYCTGRCNDQKKCQMAQTA